MLSTATSCLHCCLMLGSLPAPVTLAGFFIQTRVKMNAPEKMPETDQETKTPHVYQAINAIQSDLSKEGISKGRRNKQQGYDFRGIDDVYNALSTLLAKHGLCILPEYRERTCEQRKTSNGGAIYNVSIVGEYRMVSSIDGSSCTAVTTGEAMDSGDKATNKAMSAAYKYLCMQVFAIPTEGDNDADASTPEQTVPATNWEPIEEELRESAMDGMASLESAFNKHKEKPGFSEFWRNVRESLQAAAKAAEATE